MSLKTPVAVIGFNRPDLIEILYKRLELLRPKTLLLIGDGPREGRHQEQQLVQEVRERMKSPSWSCEIKTEFSGRNLGCRYRLASGLDWAFKQSEKLIVLEDDCLPDPTFFDYCEELLNRYENEKRVGLISGCRFLPEQKDQRESYKFSKYPFIWGWASWARAWKGYDVDMAGWQSGRDTAWLASKVNGRNRLVEHWTRAFDSIVDGFNTWDYQLFYHLLRNDLLSTVPSVNLVQNLGFRADATHTVSKGQQPVPDANSLQFPIAHPISVAPDHAMDLSLEDQVIAPSLLHRVRRKIKSRLGV